MVNTPFNGKAYIYSAWCISTTLLYCLFINQYSSHNGSIQIKFPTSKICAKLLFAIRILFASQWNQLTLVCLMKGRTIPFRVGTCMLLFDFLWVILGLLYRESVLQTIRKDHIPGHNIEKIIYPDRIIPHLVKKVEA